MTSHLAQGGRSRSADKVRWVLLGAVAWTACAGLVVLITPVVSGDASGAGESSHSIWAEEGWRAAVPVLLLVGLAAAAVAWQSRGGARWVAIGLYVALTAVMLPSVGVFFLPAVLLLLAGGALSRQRGGSVRLH